MKPINFIIGIILGLALLLADGAFAADVTRIEKDQPAPYSGQLFTFKKAREVRLELLEKDKLKAFNEALKLNELEYKQIIKNDAEQMEILKEHNLKLYKLAKDNEEVSAFKKTLYFGLGVLATSLSIYGAGQLVK